MTEPDGWIQGASFDRRHIWRACAAAGLAGLAGATAARAASPENDVMVIAQLACDAFRRGDIRAIERLLRPDFTQVNASGAVQGLSELLDEVRSGEVVYDEFRNHAMSAQFFDGVAMVRGITSLRGKYRNEPFDLDVRFTDLLERSLGHWRMVTSHVTRLPKTAREGKD